MSELKTLTGLRDAIEQEIPWVPNIHGPLRIERREDGQYFLIGGGGLIPVDTVEGGLAMMARFLVSGYEELVE